MTLPEALQRIGTGEWSARELMAEIGEGPLRGIDAKGWLSVLPRTAGWLTHLAEDPYVGKLDSIIARNYQLRLSDQGRAALAELALTASEGTQGTPSKKKTKCGGGRKRGAYADVGADWLAEFETAKKDNPKFQVKEFVAIKQRTLPKSSQVSAMTIFESARRERRRKTQQGRTNRTN